MIVQPSHDPITICFSLDRDQYLLDRTSLSSGD
jgi:hypothetical protein